MKFLGVMALAVILISAVTLSYHYEYGVVAGAIVGALTVQSTKEFWS